MNVAIILAGGIGVRFGALGLNGETVPKQFVKVNGKPVIGYTLDNFQLHPEIDVIGIVCVRNYEDYLKAVVEEYGYSKVKWIVPGGRNFQISVLNGLTALNGNISDEDVVLINFAVNPMVTSEMISDCIKVTKEKGNAISATDYYDISGRKNYLSSVVDAENYTDRGIDRECVAIMRTPYGFKYGFIWDVYQEAIQKGLFEQVEPHTTSLIYALGKKMYFSLGSQINIKITKKEDLDLFSGYVLWKEKK